MSDNRQDFVHLTVPGGYAIRQNEVGTARFYEPLNPGDSDEVEIVFDLEPSTTSADQHAFLVLADTQTQNAYEMGLLHEHTVPDVQATLQSLEDVEAFGVACGDIMFDDLSLYPEYERAVAAMGVPFFQVVGNHDLDLDSMTDEASSNTFSKHFGPRYFSFDRGLVHYVVLDDVYWHAQGYIGYLDDLQLSWLEQDLARIESGRPVVVFAHIPGLSTQYRRLGNDQASISTSITNRERLYRLLEPFQAHLITGHTHENEHVFEGGIHEHVQGTACGAWWSGPICHDGTPSGYGLYEVRGESLSWRYKSTGYDFDKQIRLYARGTNPSAPDEIVANIWDADPEWVIKWHEDGIQKGKMSNRIDADPLSVELHAGPDLPERRPWVEPKPTNHLFFAPVSPDAREIRVEAVDRFGRTYSAAIENP